MNNLPLLAYESSVTSFDEWRNACGLSKDIVVDDLCPLCHCRLHEHSLRREDCDLIDERFREYATFRHCDNCGWWSIHTERDCKVTGGNYAHVRVNNSYAVLKKFRIDDEEAPLDVIRQHLLVRYEHAGLISAKKAEELVRSVFREAHGSAEVHYFRGFAYQADEGIDLVMIETGEGPTAIQVKRRISRHVEPIADVRAFVASFLLQGFHSGVYVALTSRFSPTTKLIPVNEHLGMHGMKVRLVDADEFYAMLRRVSSLGQKRMPGWVDMLRVYDGFDTNDYLMGLIERHQGGPA